MIVPFSSVVPYVAKASVVAGVHTGSEISAASENLPELRRSGTALCRP